MATRYAGPTTAHLEPNLDDIVAHLDFWFADMPFGEMSFQYMDPATGKLNKYRRFDVSNIEQAADWVCETNAIPGQNVYLRLGLVKHDAPTTIKDEHFLRAPGPWSDLDDADAVRAVKELTKHCPYNIAIQTGETPFTRVQVAWRCSEGGYGDPEEVREINTAICNRVSGDSAVINPSTLMRVGGGIAWPYKPGRIPEITKTILFPERNRFYNPQSIRKAYVPGTFSSVETGLNSYAALQAFGDSADKEPLDVEAMLEAMAIGNIHDTQVRVSAALISRGEDRDGIFKRLLDRTREITPKPLAANFESEMTKRIDVIIDSAKAKFGAPATPDASYKPIAATQYSWTDPCSIPPRDWIYGRHYIRKFLSSTIAPGGVGKSSLVLVEAISIAIGRDLLDGKAPICRARVWYYNLEDPMEELQRRVQAVCKHFDISQTELGDNLFLDSGRDQELVIARLEDRAVKIIAPVRDSIEAEITKNNIDVLIIDPFVHSHAVTENSNDEIAEVAKEWAHIANRCDCSIELIHHTRKLNGQEVTAEDSRGGSALVGVARSVRALNRVTKDEAARCGLTDDHRSYFYMGSGDKQNLAPPAESNRWRRIVSVDLENDTPELMSDNVGVVEAFKLPDPFAGITVQHLQAVQQALAGGEQRCRANPQAKDWIGRLVAEKCELNAQTDRRKIKTMIQTWVDSKALRECEVEDGKRQMRPAYAVGEWARND